VVHAGRSSLEHALAFSEVSPDATSIPACDTNCDRGRDVGCVAPVGVSAQGGKAGPLRIAFKRGGQSATISESVRGYEEAEYVLAAKEGQRLIIRLTSVPAKSSVFMLFGEGDDAAGFKHDANFSYSGVLPKTGDYFITVKRSAAAKGTSRFRLVVTVR
jgi:hypothetical protein